MILYLVAPTKYACDRQTFVLLDICKTLEARPTIKSKALRRLCETYHDATKAAFLSASYGNTIDPQWPLCPYEARGSCRNAKCPYQMAADYTLEAVQIVRDIFITAQRSASQVFAVFLLASHSSKLARHASALHQLWHCEAGSALSMGSDVLDVKAADVMVPCRVCTSISEGTAALNHTAQPSVHTGNMGVQL